MTDIVSYDSDERTVYFTGKDDAIEIFTDVSPDEFDEIERVESYTHECMSTPDKLLHILENGAIFGAESKEALQSLKEKLIDLYEQFPEHKSLVEESAFGNVNGYSGVVYKVKRPLEHVFECVGIVADLITNSQLMHRFHRDGSDRFSHPTPCVEYVCGN